MLGLYGCLRYVILWIQTEGLFGSTSVRNGRSMNISLPNKAIRRKQKHLLRISWLEYLLLKSPLNALAHGRNTVTQCQSNWNKYGEIIPRRWIKWHMFNQHLFNAIWEVNRNQRVSPPQLRTALPRQHTPSRCVLNISHDTWQSWWLAVSVSLQSICLRSLLVSIWMPRSW